MASGAAPGGREPPPSHGSETPKSKRCLGRGSKCRTSRKSGRK